tara:strand:+ start:93 stop:275 length:183 start_codon:yes stop_codon:yes gene_type:complete
MSRCKICDHKLSISELKTIDPRSGEYSDTCSNCMASVYRDLEFEYDLNIEVKINLDGPDD